MTQGGIIPPLILRTAVHTTCFTEGYQSGTEPEQEPDGDICCVFLRRHAEQSATYCLPVFSVMSNKPNHIALAFYSLTQ